ncbi:hypothetical protein C8Q80DRAFT_598160 [Daedaleopsis nitida]|nr:hypothetical protein C8Q80DRAFT_598160 [Daedaleopsis nitida]
MQAISLMPAISYIQPHRAQVSCNAWAEHLSEETVGSTTITRFRQDLRSPPQHQNIYYRQHGRSSRSATLAGVRQFGPRWRGAGDKMAHGLQQAPAGSSMLQHSLCRTSGILTFRERPSRPRFSVSALSTGDDGILEACRGFLTVPHIARNTVAMRDELMRGVDDKRWGGGPLRWVLTRWGSSLLQRPVCAILIRCPDTAERCESHPTGVMDLQSLAVRAVPLACP